MDNEGTLTLAILAILVASHRVHTIASGAVGGWAVRLGRGQAVSWLDGVGPLAAAGRDGGSRVQASVQRGDGEVGLWLWRYCTRVAEDAHHLWERQTVPEAGLQGTITKGPGLEAPADLSNVTALYRKWALVSSFPLPKWGPKGLLPITSSRSKASPLSLLCLSLMA